MRQLEGVSQVQVVDEVGVQRVFLALEVVEVLARHILGLERGGEALVVHGNQAAHGHAGREGDGGVAGVDFGLGPHVVPRVGVIVAHIAHIVLDAVAAQRGVHVPAQPVGEAVSRRQLDTHAVALGDVFGHQLADFVDFAVEHELVLVVHVVEVGAGSEVAAA